MIRLKKAGLISKRSSKLGFGDVTGLRCDVIGLVGLLDDLGVLVEVNLSTLLRVVGLGLKFFNDLPGLVADT